MEHCLKDRKKASVVQVELGRNVEYQIRVDTRVRCGQWSDFTRSDPTCSGKLLESLKQKTEII